jgi:omega-hydroxy-beta-dihydromenaquinone-9 sulfotransferase
MRQMLTKSKHKTHAYKTAPHPDSADMQADSYDLTIRDILTLSGTASIRLLRASTHHLLPAKSASWSRKCRHVATILTAIPIGLALILWHALCHLFDEIFLRHYRHTPIERPVFIIGLPRSGTTALHRQLATSSGYTTLTTWEAALAPALIQKIAFRGISHLDRLCGQPLSRLVRWIDSLLAKSDFSRNHSLQLLAPEEDFILLLPIMACFALITLLPGDASLWQLSDFDHTIPAREKRRILAFYRACLKKHLYFALPRAQLLSKNASFLSWNESLREAFPDATRICCLRPLEDTCISQIRSLQPTMQHLAPAAIHETEFTYRIRNMIERYGRLATHHGHAADPRWITVPFDAICNRLPDLAASLMQLEEQGGAA